MADPTLLNGQITDSITQVNVKVLGDAPAQAMGSLYQVAAQVSGLSMENAVANQQQITTLDNVVTTQGVNSISTMVPAIIARTTQEILTGNAIAELVANLKTVMASFPTQKQ